MTTNQPNKRLFSGAAGTLALTARRVTTLTVTRAAMMLLVMMLTTMTAWADITPTTPSQDGDGNYLIGNAAELYGFAEIVNGGNATANAKLTADIVVNENVLAANGDANTGDFEQWTPIGNDLYNDKVYSGTFDGQGHTISGLYVSISSADQFGGLIGTPGASVVVKNLGVVDSYFGSTYNLLGSIVGNVSYGSTVTLANVYSTSTVAGDNWIGGLVGGDGSGSVTIINSYFAGKTSANWAYGTHHDDLVSGEFNMPISGTHNVVNAFVLGTSLYGTQVTAAQLTDDGTVAAALHYYQDALADGSIWGISGGKTGFSGSIDGVSVTTADITLHTFDGDATVYSSKYIVGNTTPLPLNVVRNGYQFFGWYDNADFEGDAVTQISSSATGNKEYWAKFERSHAVSFVLDGGNIYTGEIDHYIEGETTALPTFVLKDGASFEGWYTTEDFTGNRYYFIPATATEDMAFYAKWGEAKTTFYLVQGGSPEPVNILYEGENIVWLDETTMDGYSINDYGGNCWGGFESSINVPYTGGESTFGNGGRGFYVSQSGFYVFTLTDKGDGSWFISVLYPLENYCTVSDIPDQTYTGSAITPAIDIETTLTLDTDYTIEYSDNTNVGTATVTVTGIGNYGGTIERTFTINPKTVPVPTAVIGLIYTGSEQTGVAGGEGYTVTGGTATATGNHTATATLNDASNYQWSDQTTEPQEIAWSIAYYAASLADDADNAAELTNIIGNYGGKADVTLQGRTLFKDGKWNTLCLPFALSAAQIAAHTDFSGATLMMLDTDGKNGFDTTDGTLWLTFKSATAIAAGVPYLVKWDAAGDDFTSPTFSGVTIDATASTTVSDADDELQQVQMVGCYSPVPVVANDKSILFLGDANTLYYSSIDRDIRSCRAYFSVPYIKQNASAKARAFRLDFGDGEQTGIMTVQGEGFAVNGADAWYTLDGRKLDAKPTTKGLYINGGKKVAIK